MNLSDSVALVTGAASGLGNATARALHERGAAVVLVDLPSSAGAAAAADLGDRAVFVPGDVTSPDDIAAAVAAATDLGPLRTVVNCAGVATPGKVLGRGGARPLAVFARVVYIKLVGTIKEIRLAPQPLDVFERVVKINLVGTFNVIRLAAEQMVGNEPVDGDRGVIVNTASVAAFDGQIGQPAYAASKGGVAAMTLPIARELAAKQIRVMTIAPGIFETPMLAGLPEDAQRSLGAQVPHPSRLGRATEYAALAMHIVENAMLNGETIRLDGAIRMAPK
ncbi:SDR family NAD(P)-dependent oxidoreductase [Gordonia sp. (in: high G+C Gram-positive bacteria)]|uniref:SDR family NAD(P)-dependent oxidoreductase n=1 Tax=Gordonia sp. (in: high G+C Gram-positive bacteria) TaxID=84139 RepID=UPI0026064584|nr:SDR family NAD(P)-dependent oxidoreductase [Gordonia sp. (in: high G+C Gram-positive bacteria)]